MVADAGLGFKINIISKSVVALTNAMLELVFYKHLVSASSLQSCLYFWGFQSLKLLNKCYQYSHDFSGLVINVYR